MSHCVVDRPRPLSHAPKVFSPGKTWLERARLTFTVLSRALFAPRHFSDRLEKIQVPMETLMGAWMSHQFAV